MWVLRYMDDLLASCIPVRFRVLKCVMVEGLMLLMRL